MWPVLSLFYILSVLILPSASASGSSLTKCTSDSCSRPTNEARYDFFRYYRLHIDTKEQVDILQELEEKSDSFIFYGHARHPDQNLTIMVASHKIAEMEDLLERYKIEGKVLLYNVQALIDAEKPTIKPPDTPVEYFDWRHYFHLETINAWMQKKIEQHSFLTPISLGVSYEGREVRGVKLSRKRNNPAVFIEGGIHAREWISPATATFILNKLIYSEDPKIRDLSTTFDWFFFPNVNPDGYLYTFESDRLWRKNRKPYGVCRGVDLNRNFDANWGGVGCSKDPCRYDFAGSAAFSEPETANFEQFFKDHAEKDRIKAFISLHSFSQLLMFPYGWKTDKAKNYDDLKVIGEKAVKAIEETHGSKFVSGASIETIYPSSGDSVDWAYDAMGVNISYIIELRGPPDSVDLFILPAEQIIPSGEEILEAFVTILTEARELGYFD